MRITIGVLTVSGDPDARESATVITNAAIRALSHAGYESIVTRTSGESFAAQKSALLELCDTCDVVFTAGGSGFGSNDVMPEVTRELIDRQANGVAELIRTDLHHRSQVSHLHRGIAGIRGQTVIINLPSSAEMVKDGIETVSLLIRPMMSALKGQKAVQDVH